MVHRFTGTPRWLSSIWILLVVRRIASGTRCYRFGFHIFLHTRSGMYREYSLTAISNKNKNMWLGVSSHEISRTLTTMYALELGTGYYLQKGRKEVLEKIRYGLWLLGDHSVWFSACLLVSLKHDDRLSYLPVQIPMFLNISLNLKGISLRNYRAKDLLSRSSKKKKEQSLANQT